MYSLFGLTCVVLILSVVVSDDRQQYNGTCSICNCQVKDVVNCSNKNLTYIPRDLNISTKVLNLSSNFLQAIDAGSFENLTNLISLDLHNTSLKAENVSENAFKGLTNLRFLNIAQNDQFPLTNHSTKDKLFCHMTSLKELRMYGTTGTYNIEYGYPDVQLSRLSSLTELWIDGLTNMIFGPAFRNMTNLKVLRIAGDQIKPSWRSKEFCMIENLKSGMLDNLATVTHLYIRKCQIRMIDKDAFKALENLEYLDLSNNRKLNLEIIFASLCSLSNKTKSLILNSVVPQTKSTCGYRITTNMIECLRDKSIQELSLNHNIINLIDPGALSVFPETLQVISASRNEFFLGFYLFDVYHLTNLTKLDVSYQFFTDKTSIWQGNKEQELLEIARRKTINLRPELITNGSNNQRYVNKFRASQDEDSSVSHGSAFLEFVQQFFTSILQQDGSHLSIRQTELSSTEAVCPQNNKDKYIPPGTIVGKIPPNLKFLDLSHSKLASPINEIFINDSNSLEEINASFSLLYCWDGPIHGIEKLQILDLSNNFCNKVSNRFFQRVHNLKRLNISFNVLDSVIRKDAKGLIMSNLTSLQMLDISFNLINKIPEKFLKSQKSLVWVYAKFNKLQRFNVDISHMTNLSLLDLRGNQISTLSEKTCNNLENIANRRTKNNRSKKRDKLILNLMLNSIDCSCNNIRFLKWLFRHSDSNCTLIVDISHCVQSGNETKITSRHILGQIVDQLEYQCRSYTNLIIGLSVALAFIINVILGALVHRFRWKIQYWYFVVFDTKSKRRYVLLDDPRFKFDVFVASSDDNKEFAIDKLRPVLKAAELTAFIAVYHINFNDNLVDIIGKTMHASRVVIFVFSDDWSTDHCMDIAVHMWQCDMLQRERPAVLGIHLDTLKGMDVEKVRDIFCTNFIEYPGSDDEQEREAFWRECVQNIRELIV